MPTVKITSKDKATVNSNRGKSNRGNYIVLAAAVAGSIVLILVIIALAVLINDYIQLREGADRNGVELSERERERQAQEALNSLRDIMLLPDEEPTIATIVDIDLLRADNPVFYENAEELDNLFLFVETRQAILYRMNENKIINVADIEFDQSDADTLIESPGFEE